MATLSDAAKRFIVQALACYDTPTQVAEAVKEEFGLDVHRAQIAQYDPTKRAGSTLAKKWRNLLLALQVLEQAAKETGEAYINLHRKEEQGGDDA